MACSRENFSFFIPEVACWFLFTLTCFWPSTQSPHLEGHVLPPLGAYLEAVCSVGHQTTRNEVVTGHNVSRVCCEYNVANRQEEQNAVVC